ncbi:hypothetical protein CHUAL_000646 [Chamberlinius hualienensis]
MAALVEGRQYGLSSKGLSNENKTRIFVKLTDSALKAVEEHLISRNNCKQPTIQVIGNQGLLVFPSDAGDHKFNFGLSSTSDIEGPQGSFECIQQTGSRSLESLGSLQFKIHIQAKEDVYQITKQRMAEAEEENKKNCTKIIKETGPYVGRKVKKNTHLSKPYSGSHSINHNSSHHVKNGGIYNNIKSNGVNGYHNNNNNNNSVNYNKSLSNSKPVGNSDIQKRPLRDRIVQLLAIRPYKLPELLARLMKDGLVDKDKPSVSSILNKVGTSKDGSRYIVTKEAWSEVQDDWPYYSEFEKQLVKRRKVQSLSAGPPSLQYSGSDSPVNSQTGSSPNSSQKQKPKRPSAEPEHPSNKRRISHYNHSSNGKHENSDGHGPVSRVDVLQNNSKPDSVQLNGVSRTSSDNRNGSISKLEVNGIHNGICKSDMADLFGDKTEINGHSDSYSQKSELNGWNSSNHNLISQTANNHSNGGASNNSSRHTNLSPTLSTLPHMTPLPSPDGQDGLELRSFLNDNSNSCGDISYSDNYSDYLKKYTEIVSSEQRARYKSDFNAEYLKYRDVHAVVDRVSKRFSTLKENLRNVDEGSDAWKKVKDQILREYDEMKLDSKYQDARQKFQLMHEKLSHIKRLIFDYDQLNGSKS